MKQEEKQLLLQDLCGRLPYGVKIYVRIFRHDEVLEDINLLEGTINGCISEVKPYLRPMSSMTEEEEKEYNDLYYDAPQFKNGWRDAKYLEGLHIDWLNKNMFDYRGLIPMGLALEAKENMYS